MFFDASDLTLLTRLAKRGATGARSDDNEESIKFRIQVFHSTNSKIIDHYINKTKRVLKTARVFRNYMHFFCR